MAVGCGAKCAKFLLIAFNLVFWLSGACVLGIGLWLRLDKNANKIIELAQVVEGDKSFEIACYILIAIGAFVFVVGFLGCCGAIRESKCLLGLYIFALVVVFIVELAAGILAAVYKDDIVATLEEKLGTTLNKELYYSDKTTYMPTVWGAAVNFAQAKFECCGFVEESGSDYIAANFSVKYDIPFPYTCCKLKEGVSSKDWAEVKEENVNNWDLCETKATGEFYSKPCKQSIIDWVESNAIILIGIGIGIACLEIFGFIFAICLCRNTGEEA